MYALGILELDMVAASWYIHRPISKSGVFEQILYDHVDELNRGDWKTIAIPILIAAGVILFAVLIFKFAARKS